MSENIKCFIYNNDCNYTSYSGIKTLMICVCWFMSLIIGTYAIVAKLWYMIAVLLIINGAFLLHLLLLKFFYKKTYVFRFMSDWIVDVLLQGLFLTSAYTALLATECETDFVIYGTLISYVIWIILSFIWLIFRSKSDLYKNYIQSRKPIINKWSSITGSLIPVSGVIGMSIGKIIFGVFDFKNQTVVYIAFYLLILVSMLFSLGNASILKYYYCKKYSIMYDADGNDTSPLLSPRANLKTQKEQEKRSKDKKQKDISGTRKPISASKKILSIFLLVLIGIGALLVLVFLVFFIKTII